MIKTSARVISSADGTALVEPTKDSGCGGCKSHSSCGISGLGKYFSTDRKAIAVRCDANVSAGDELQLTMSESDFLKAGLLAYLLPSLLTITGAAFSSSLGFGDVGALLGAIAGFASGLLIVRLLAWKPRMSVAPTNSMFNQGDTP